ncbi:hypothetical protein AK812_SmicGene45800 [Symbiodinium microadriaticum]|uniref:Uncharacterized protein n=1 Tax=Symbiodinium microadriaticum TaxID=2951 RepID=A0A1Q9BVC3_SYMMI|nr:hypothetical protein AK812_SmicGene45800 [Symbiodinium microadriaticum]
MWPILWSPVSPPIPAHPSQLLRPNRRNVQGLGPGIFAFGATAWAGKPRQGGGQRASGAFGELKLVFASGAASLMLAVLFHGTKLMQQVLQNRSFTAAGDRGRAGLSARPAFG